MSYPELWAPLKVSFLQSLTPGHKFAHMRIQAFENQTELACVITSNVPKEGFRPSLDYNITVSSSLEGGVGHLIKASAGQFHTLRYGFQEAAFTDKSERQSHVTWAWRSPAVDEAVVVGHYALCATAYGGHAFVATALDLAREGTPATPCSVGESAPATEACLCSSRFPGAAVCPAGFCCWSHGVCLECKPRIGPNWSLWLHSFFALSASGLVLSFSTTFDLVGKMQIVDAIQKKTACFVQLLGLVSAFFYVQARDGWRQHFTVGRAAHNLLGLAAVASSIVTVCARFHGPPNSSHQVRKKPRLFVWCTSAAFSVVAVCTGISGAAFLDSHGHLVAVSSVGACVFLGCALIWQLIMWRCHARSRRNADLHFLDAGTSNDQPINVT